MKEKNSILHSTKDYGDILISKEYDTDGYRLKIQFYLGCFEASLNIDIEDEDSANQIFVQYENESNAINSVRKIIEEIVN